MKHIKCGITLMLLSFIIACQPVPCQDNVNGTVKDLEGLDGCGLVIQLDNDQTLVPLNLDEFDLELADGTQVNLSYSLQKNAMGICMTGDIAKIDCIVIIPKR